MNAKEYVIGKLKEVSKKINGISLRYAFDEITDFHIIEVYPESIRRANEDYMKLESDLWTEFYSLYPNEDILISEVCESNDMTNVIYDSSLDYQDIVDKIVYTYVKPYKFDIADCYIEAGENNYALAA